MRGNWLKKSQPPLYPPIQPMEGFIWIWLPLVIFFSIFSLYLLFYTCSSTWESVTIYDLKKTSDYQYGSGSQYGGYYNQKYLVYTSKGIVECNTSGVYGIQNKEKLFNTLQKGKKYSVRIVGWDIESMGWRRTLVAANKIE